MITDKIGQYQEFIRHSLLIDQTKIIDSILTPDTYVEYMNAIQNNEFFNIALSTGKLTGTLPLILDIQADIKSILNSKKARASVTSSIIEMETLQADITRLESDLFLLENAVSSKRYIFSWLLVPYWLSKELALEGEVVFDCLGSHFWGITSLYGDDSCHNILKELSNEIIISN